jgi:hypothetical protein
MTPRTARPLLAAGLALACSVVTAAEPVSYPYQALQRCPFSTAELSAATGLKVELVPLMTFAGAPQPMTAPKEGQMFLSCSATDGAQSASLLITQRWFEPATAAARIKALILRDQQAAQPVPGDADGARWLSELQGARQVLFYVRRNVMVEVWVNGVPPALRDGLREKLLKLRRVPQ